MGPSRGQLVAVRLPPRAFASELNEVWDRGAAVAPLSPSASDSEVAGLLEALKPAELVDAAGRHSIGGAIPVAEGVAAVVVTSGTSGEPKGVELTRGALETSALAGSVRLGARPTDRWLCCLPTHHVAGLQVIVRSLMAGSEPLVHDRFDAGAVGREQEATLVSLVPAQLRGLLEAGVDLSHFRRILLGGAAASPALIEEAAAAGAKVTVSYGMTETCGGCVYDGRPLDGVEVRVAESGRIEIRGPVLMRGYRLRPDLTSGALREGWLSTSDFGAVGGDGRLQVLGRMDELIVTGGEKVAPAEVEAILLEHPEVADVAVAGRPDDRWGQRVCAFVVPVPGRTPDLAELRRWVASRTSAYRAPRELELVESIPRSPTGKTDRVALLGHGTDASPA